MISKIRIADAHLAVPPTKPGGSAVRGGIDVPDAGIFPRRPVSHARSITSGFWDNNSQICIELDGPISPTVPLVSDVLALDNVFTSGSPLTPGPSPLLTFESNGILNNNTSPCTSAVLATGARCGEGFVINMIMKR